MARLFNLRDLALVRRLSERGTVLHTETALTRRWQPLWGALHSLVANGEEVTFVCRGDNKSGAGFVQIQISDDNSRAHLVFISADDAAEAAEPYQLDVPPAEATESLDKNLWLALLDGAVTEIGQRGVHSLVADVDESGPELIMLRRAGFVVYTRQDIWVLEGEPPSNGEQTLLEPYRPDDDWEMALLYSHIVPPLIQMVEPTPPDNGVLWTMRDAGRELAAFVHVHDGPDAVWLRLFIHPNAQSETAGIIAAAVQTAAPRADHPVYCCVRRYQSWLQSYLAASGFQLWGSQAVMVKHTLHPIKDEQPSLAGRLATQGATTPPTPYLHIPDRRIAPPVKSRPAGSVVLNQDSRSVRREYDRQSCVDGLSR